MNPVFAFVNWADGAMQVSGLRSSEKKLGQLKGIFRKSASLAATRSRNDSLPGLVVGTRSPRHRGRFVLGNHRNSTRPCRERILHDPRAPAHHSQSGGILWHGRRQRETIVERYAGHTWFEDMKPGKPALHRGQCRTSGSKYRRRSASIRRLLAERCWPRLRNRGRPRVRRANHRRARCRGLHHYRDGPVISLSPAASPRFDPKLGVHCAGTIACNLPIAMASSARSRSFAVWMTFGPACEIANARAPIRFTRS